MSRLLRLARVIPDYALHVWKGLLAPGLGIRRRVELVQGVVLDGGRVVLTVRRNLRGWELPGGTVDAGEPLEVALRREVLEETGLVVEVGRRVGTYERSGFRPHVAHVFECSPVVGELRPSWETPEVAWFDTRRLPEGLFPWFRGPLQDALAGLSEPVRRRERQGPAAVLAGLRIDLRARLHGTAR